MRLPRGLSGPDVAHALRVLGDAVIVSVARTNV